MTMTTELVELADDLDRLYCEHREDREEVRRIATELRALASREGGSDGWVAVTDRLPEPYQDVEVYPSWDDDTSNTYCPHDGGTNGRKAGNWYHNDREGYDHKIRVTHWRPRANPPAAPEPVAVGLWQTRSLSPMAAASTTKPG